MFVYTLLWHAGVLGKIMTFSVLIVKAFSIPIYQLDMIPKEKRTLKYFAKGEDNPEVYRHSHAKMTEQQAINIIIVIIRMTLQPNFGTNIARIHILAGNFQGVKFSQMDHQLTFCIHRIDVSCLPYNCPIHVYYKFVKGAIQVCTYYRCHSAQTAPLENYQLVYNR